MFPLLKQTKINAGITYMLLPLLLCLFLSQSLHSSEHFSHQQSESVPENNTEKIHQAEQCQLFHIASIENNFSLTAQIIALTNSVVSLLNKQFLLSSFISLLPPSRAPPKY